MTSPAPRHEAEARLRVELARVARLHEARERDPELANALQRLARWQAARLRATYADLAVQPRYARAIDFFEKDLYGDADFGRRDADLARVVPVMVKMLPEKVIATVADAVGLNALSHDLDRGMLPHLPDPFRVADYCAAYRAIGRRDEREQQIALILRVGAALDVHVSRPLIRSALAMMRRPARVAGFGALHDFLERGFSAFHAMHGANEFLATVAARETELMDRIYAGDAAPFPEP